MEPVIYPIRKEITNMILRREVICQTAMQLTGSSKNAGLISAKYFVQLHISVKFAASTIHLGLEK